MSILYASVCTKTKANVRVVEPHFTLKYTQILMRVQLGLKWLVLYYNFTVVGNCSIQWLMYFRASFLSEDRLGGCFADGELQKMKDERNLWVPRQWILELFYWLVFNNCSKRRATWGWMVFKKNAVGCNFPRLLSGSESDYCDISAFTVPYKPAQILRKCTKSI